MKAHSLVDKTTRSVEIANAQVAELVDAEFQVPVGAAPWKFESSPGHHCEVLNPTEEDFSLVLQHKGDLPDDWTLARPSQSILKRSV